jgi:hypothetical protein
LTSKHNFEEDSASPIPKKVIKPAAVTLFHPLDSDNQYHVRTIGKHKLDPIPETRKRLLFSPSPDESSDGSTGSSPDLELFPVQNRFRNNQDYFEDNEAYRIHAVPENRAIRSPERDPPHDQLHNVVPQVVQAPEEEIVQVCQPNHNLIMADPNPDLAGIIQDLQGDDNGGRQQAIVHLAQFVQRINAPAQAPQVPARITLRTALENTRAGAVDALKVTDLMPDSWGSMKDGDPESHCIRFESYANVQGYDDDQTKITWFQATLKGEALNWITAETDYATWDDLKRAFIAEFENQPSRNVAIANFRKINWNGTERASTYLQKLKKAARLINANDEEVMVQFQLGLPKSVKLFFGATNPANLKDMTLTLQKYLELHGPVTISTDSATLALNTIAEVLTGGTSNPFMQSQHYTQSAPIIQGIQSEDPAVKIRYLQQQNSMLNTLVNENTDANIKKQDGYQSGNRDKRVRFEEGSYRPNSRDHRRKPRPPVSSGESGESDYEEEMEGNYGYEPRRRNRSKDKSNDRDDKSHSHRRSHRDQSYEVTKQMAKMMPVMAAMADATHDPRYNGNKGYSGQPSGNNGYNTVQEGHRYPSHTNYRGNNYRPQHNAYRGGHGNYQGQSGSFNAYRGSRGGRSRGQGRYNKPGVPPGDGKCYHCGIYGHFMSDCRKRLRNEGPMLPANRDPQATTNTNEYDQHLE